MAQYKVDLQTWPGKEPCGQLEAVCNILRVYLALAHGTHATQNAVQIRAYRSRDSRMAVDKQIDTIQSRSTRQGAVYEWTTGGRVQIVVVCNILRVWLAHGTRKATT